MQDWRRLNLVLVILLSGILVMGCPPPGAMVQPRGWAGPVIADGILYIVSEGRLIAMDVLDRTEIWRFPREAEPPIVAYGTPLVSEGRIFIGAFNGKVYALDALTGEMRWGFTTGGPIVGSPAIAGNALIVGSSDGKLYALNVRDGTLLWDKPFASGGKIWSDPVISRNLVFFGNLARRLYAVDIRTGLLEWSKEFDGAIASTPLIVGRTLYVGSFDFNFHALDAETGFLEWLMPFEARNWFWTRPIYHGGMIFVGSLDHHIYAIDARTGMKKWSEPTGGGIRSAAVIVEGVLIVASGDGTVRGLDPRTGDERWAPRDLGTPILAHPWVEGNTVYLIDQRNTLHALEGRTGQEVWRITLE
ncbi:MAG: PQQ-binding-like beta-propeller repeat protein [Dehalococcoidia bacterium]